MGIRCQKCDALNIDSAQNCLYCGAELSSAEKYNAGKICRQCGAMNESQNSFCFKCGSSFWSNSCVTKKELNVNNVIIKVLLILIAVIGGIYCANEIYELNMYLNEVGFRVHDMVEEEVMKWWFGVACAIVCLIIGLIIPAYNKTNNNR